MPEASLSLFNRFLFIHGPNSDKPNGDLDNLTVKRATTAQDGISSVLVPDVERLLMAFAKFKVSALIRAYNYKVMWLNPWNVRFIFG